MSKIKIADISKDEVVSKEDFKKVFGGICDKYGWNSASRGVPGSNLVVWEDYDQIVIWTGPTPDTSVAKSVADL